MLTLAEAKPIDARESSAFAPWTKDISYDVYPQFGSHEKVVNPLADETPAASVSEFDAVWLFEMSNDFFRPHLNRYSVENAETATVG